MTVFFLHACDTWSSSAAPPLQPDTPKVPADQPNFDAIESIVRQGIQDGQMPGAVVVIADRDGILYRRAFGQRQVEPTAEPMTLDTVFDLASLTKPVATATSVMQLIGDGLISPHQKVADHLPEFGKHGKDKITIAVFMKIGGSDVSIFLSLWKKTNHGNFMPACKNTPADPISKNNHTISKLA